MGWREITSDPPRGGKMLSTMSMETDCTDSSENDTQTNPSENRLFCKEVGSEITSLNFNRTNKLDI